MTGRPPTSRILVGDARERLRDLPDGVVQCVVTSPPFYGLRDYGTGEWVGGDPEHEHEVEAVGRGAWLGERSLEGSDPPTHVLGAPHRGGARGTHCSCGAEFADAQLGLEPTPDAYVDAIVDIFREVRRVLRDDGVAWLNLGDSYAAARSPDHHAQTGLNAAADRFAPTRSPRNRSAKIADYPAKNVPDAFKPKDLLGIPWRVALALQADGWYLRSDVVWAKPNPIPESVSDRPTKSHEYVFLLAKAERYYYDAHAVRERGTSGPSDVRKVTEDRERNLVKDAGGDPAMVAASAGDISRRAAVGDGQTRNRRSVWWIATRPYKDAHFATFPPELVEPCVLAGSSPMRCERCRAPWTRVLERTAMVVREGPGRAGVRDAAVGASTRTAVTGTMVKPPTARTTGWRPTCACGAPEGVRPGDLDEIESPVGEGGTDNDWRSEGRGGLARARNGDEGTRTMTRYEQRQYARQLRQAREDLPAEWEDMVDRAGGPETMAHYLRTDRTGARAIPPGLLDRWIDDGVLERVEVPEWEPPPAEPSLVLDPFAGSGTTGVVCGWHGRSFVGVELSAEYAAMAEQRIALEGKPSRRPAERVEVSDDQLTLLA